MEDPLHIEPVNLYPQQFSFKINDLQIEVKELPVKVENFIEDTQRVVRGTKLFFKQEELFLVCLWKGCSNKCHSLWSDFQLHVETHLSELTENSEFYQYFCEWKGCDFVENDIREMARHLQFHSYHAKLKCHGKNILYSEHINTSMNWSDIKTPCTVAPKKIPKLKRYKCEWIGCTSQDIDWLQPMDFFEHVYAHNHLGEDYFYKCLWSGCTTYTKKEIYVSKFQAHMKSHTNEKLIACPNCGSMFTNRIKFFDHCKRQDIQEASFPCGECGKVFPTQRIFKDHARAHEKPYNCHICSQTCTSPSSLKNHMTHKHTSERPFPCEFLHCNYSGKTKADLKIHGRKHQKTVLQCISCEYKCKASQTLKNHIRDNHSSVPTIYACHLCDFKSNRSTKLSFHLGVHDVYFSKELSRFVFKLNPQTGFHQLKEGMTEQATDFHSAKPDMNHTISNYEAVNDSIALNIKNEVRESDHDFYNDTMVEALYNTEDIKAGKHVTEDMETKIARSRINAVINDQIQVVENTSIGVFFSCRPCGKVSSRKQELKNHIQSHLEGITYTCMNCNLEYRTMNSVNMHLFNAKNCKLRKDKKYSIKIAPDGPKVSSKPQENIKRGRKAKQKSEKVDELFDFSIFMGSVGM